MRYTPPALILIGLVFTIYSLVVSVGQAVGHIYVVGSRVRNLTEGLGRMEATEIRRAFEVPADVSDPTAYVLDHIIVPKSFYDTYSTYQGMSTGLGLILLALGVSELVVRRRGENLLKRRRDQGQCTSCGYERSGTNAPVACPECGHM